jgi:hypothetical protein
MKKILLWARVIFMLLFVHDVYAQESFESINKRSLPFEPLILSAAKRHNVDPNLLWTIAYLESRFNPRAISYKDGRPCAFGLMQFMPTTASRFSLTNPFDPSESVDAAARYVRYLLKVFDGRGDLVLAGYNAGEGTVQAFRDGRRLILSHGKIINPRAIRTGGIPPYEETRSYVAQGHLIYQRIVREGRFSDVNKASPLESLVRPSALEEDRGESSFYSSDYGANREPRIHRQGSLKTDSSSIYPD